MNLATKCLAAISLLCLAGIAQAQKWNEATYVEKLCSDHKDSGFSQSNRMDCQTVGYTIEFDWVDKYKEGIGQALAYSANDTGQYRKPGVVLLCQKSDGTQLSKAHCTKRFQATLAIFEYHKIDARVWLCPYRAEALFECEWEDSAL